MINKFRLALNQPFLSCIFQNKKLQRILQFQRRFSGHNVRSQSTVMAKLPEQSHSRVIKKLNYKEPSFLQVAVNNTEQCIEVTWENTEETSKYPFVWLRDNCQCESCFDQSAQSRTMLLNDLNLNTEPHSLKISNNQLNVHIGWSEGHESTFSADWLNQRSFNKNAQDSRRHFYRLPKQYWSRESIQNIPKINYNYILETDEGLLNWLQNLEIFGLVFITGAPARLGAVRKLAERVAFVRRTHYGEEFSVKAKSGPSNVAYSSGPLQLHADLPYYKYKPGTQLIHCIEQFKGDGGDSLLADAMNVAYHFKKEKEEYFEILSNILVNWCDVGQETGHEFCKVLQQPIICANSKGEIERINFSQPQRDSFFNVSLNDVTKWYTAYKAFYTALQSPQYCYKFKMVPGEIQSFDNLRIVHGRTGYNSKMGNREMEGCYIDWDEVTSRRRVLQLKFQ